MRQLRTGDRFLRGKTVRLISQTNEQLGLVSFESALTMAARAGLDLVEMPSKADNPVCKIMDYGKFQFDEAKRQREARKSQVQPKVKEIKLHANIDDNDFQIKSRHIVEFLQRGDKVKLLLAFRGREMAHPEIGEAVLQKMLQAVDEFANIDSPPKRMGRSITTLLSGKAPQRKDKPKDKASAPAPDKASASPAAPADDKQ
ncbi:MAG: translation initiation factor IF-3 [Oligosphaeraceae bacterium]|nr:translation initiation factor IF-3 [Oligosphaeraceae bacterium]